MSKIQQALHEQFKRHRIVIWYDAKDELRGEFDALILPGIEMVELANNQFAIKHRILREQPAQKFLLYYAGAEPEGLDNWLLDVQLAQGVFRADQSALWLSELDLGQEFVDLALAHPEFLQDEERRRALKPLLVREDTFAIVRMKMLAVCAGCEARLEDVLATLLDELAAKEQAKADLITACHLAEFLWERVKRAYDYKSTAPGIRDFAIELFKSAYRLGLGQDAALNMDSLVFIKHWKDSLSHHSAFETLSDAFAPILNIEQDLAGRDTQALVELDIFRAIDQKVLSDLVRGAMERTLSADDCAAIVRQRRRLHWYRQFEPIYEAVQHAAVFIKTLEEVNLAMSSLADGVQRYSQTWHRLDQLYRQIIFCHRKAGFLNVLKPLVERIDNLYSNNYLLKLNNNWQEIVDACTVWDAEPFVSQQNFYRKWVQPVLESKKKIYVIISDALRYEVADELLVRIRREDRYDAQITPLLTTLPSYTQLGMAALLPNHSLQFADNDTGTVLVDGVSSAGTQNRDKILKQAHNDRAAAVRAEDLLEMTRDTVRDLLRDTDVVYIYHNRIDAMGDKKESEERVFEAVEDTLVDLITIVKKLTAGNATNLLITSDHGFIYQNRAIDDSDFTGTEASGRQILFLDRRFVLGKGLNAQPSLRKFLPAEVGLTGEIEIQIPKSIIRLRLRGSGSRYVHGGASLQEVVVPVIQINKKRESDISQVEVDILRGTATVITSGQFTAGLYQTEPVSEKVQARRLRAAIYAANDELISDRHELVFDFESENPRQRESQVRFIFSQAASRYNNQEVVLKLEEQVPGTMHYQVYKSARYTLRRSFSSDFDF